MLEPQTLKNSHDNPLLAIHLRWPKHYGSPTVGVRGRQSYLESLQIDNSKSYTVGMSVENSPMMHGLMVAMQQCHVVIPRTHACEEACGILWVSPHAGLLNSPRKSTRVVRMVVIIVIELDSIVDV
eukprot:s2797_g6.t1